MSLKASLLGLGVSCTLALLRLIIQASGVRTQAGVPSSKPESPLLPSTMAAFYLCVSRILSPLGS